MMKKSATVLALLVTTLFAHAAGAQASIRGVVRDSANRPMPNADVIVVPANRRARTDSTGRFSFDSLGGGQYIVRARRVGYGPTEWTVELSKSGHADIQLVLGSRLAMLDTVFVSEGHDCDPRKYEGFMCRRASAKGTFIDFTDIDTMQVYYTADLLRDVGGFTSVVRPTRNGPTRIASGKACTIVLVNGVSTVWSEVPEQTYMIIGIEIYKNPKEIPKEYSRYTWGRENCWLVAYWTYDPKYRPMTVPRLGRP